MSDVTKPEYWLSKIQDDKTKAVQDAAHDIVDAGNQRDFLRAEMILLAFATAYAMTFVAKCPGNGEYCDVSQVGKARE